MSSGFESVMSALTTGTTAGELAGGQADIYATISENPGDEYIVVKNLAVQPSLYITGPVSYRLWEFVISIYADTMLRSHNLALDFVIPDLAGVAKESNMLSMFEDANRKFRTDVVVTVGNCDT